MDKKKPQDTKKPQPTVKTGVKAGPEIAIIRR
jgi:hypothetical protein